MTTSAASSTSQSHQELVAFLSQDLLAQLARIRAMSPALADPSQDHARHTHERINSEVDAMASTVEDLMELSRGQTSSPRPVAREINVNHLISRAITNLVIDSMRHTPVSGVVTVRSNPVNDCIEIIVTDQCGGLRHHDGTPLGAGLDLGKVKAIVDTCAGDIQLTNTPEGCQFSVLLPSAACSA